MPDERRPFATAGVAIVATASFVVLLFSASRYGFFGDELYFMAAGRRPSFGYADQGPVVPLIAHAMDVIAPGSLLVLRLPSILLTVGAVVTSAAIAWELGGGRAGQLLAAGAYALSPFLLLQGNMLTTSSVDTALWVVIDFLLVRWVRTRRDQLLLWASVVTAVDMQVKWLAPLLWLVIVGAVLVVGPRELLRRPVLWLGTAVVVAATTPALVWQAHHGWPQAAMTQVIRSERWGFGGPVMYVPWALFLAGPLGAVLLVYGIWRLLRGESLRLYRFLGPTVPILFVLFAVTGGHVYYAAGLYAPVMAAGAVEMANRPARWTTIVTVPVVTVAATLIVYLLPWHPASRIRPPTNTIEASLKLVVLGQFGWPELTAATVTAYHHLSPTERQVAVIVTAGYWQASALDHFGRDELAPVYSPQRGFGYFGAPPDSAGTVLYIGGDESELRSRFTTVT
ncbi:MAG: glycosyltransferase family 39 protein, partial [Mycobacterium sp.]|nr:glycosyltransferase family 39 protein [Mycobacterium sp.]